MKIILGSFLKYIDLFFVLAIALFTVSNLFQPGFFPSHDGEYHVIRFYEFDKTLRNGNWYPLWASDLNYTYGLPLFNYVYPLPNYISSLFHFLGASFINSFKLNLIFASLIGSITSYLYSKARFGKWGGVLTSVFYTLAPYHLLDIYIRGSVGEVWSLGFFPLCLYFFDQIVLSHKPRIIVLSAISISLVIFSHNILALMFVIFLIFYSMFLILQQKERKSSAISIILAFIGGLGLSSIFVLPALLEQHYVAGLKIYDVLENFPEIYQLLIPSWGSGFSGQSSLTQMSFQIGLANLLVLILVIIKLFRKTKERKLIYFFLIVFFFLFFMITPHSSFLWQRIAIIQYFQFPWRLLSLLILSCAILAGSITVLYKSKLIYILLLLVIILTTYTYAKAPYFWKRDDNYYITRENFIYGSNSLGNAFQTKWLSQQKNIPGKNKEIKLIEYKTTKRIYEVTIQEKKQVVFPIAYFPGWKAIVSGGKLKVINKGGKISVELPKGKTVINLILTDTKTRLIARTITVFMVAFVTLILLKPAVLQYFYAYRNR